MPTEGLFYAAGFESYRSKSGGEVRIHAERLSAEIFKGIFKEYNSYRRDGLRPSTLFREVVGPKRFISSLMDTKIR